MLFGDRAFSNLNLHEVMDVLIAVEDSERSHLGLIVIKGRRASACWKEALHVPIEGPSMGCLHQRLWFIELRLLLN